MSPQSGKLRRPLTGQFSPAAANRAKHRRTVLRATLTAAAMARPAAALELQSQDLTLGR